MKYLSGEIDRTYLVKGSLGETFVAVTEEKDGPWLVLSACCGDGVSYSQPGLGDLACLRELLDNYERRLRERL